MIQLTLRSQTIAELFPVVELLIEKSGRTTIRFGTWISIKRKERSANKILNVTRQKKRFDNKTRYKRPRGCWKQRRTQIWIYNAHKKKHLGKKTTRKQSPHKTRGHTIQSTLQNYHPSSPSFNQGDITTRMYFIFWMILLFRNKFICITRLLAWMAAQSIQMKQGQDNIRGRWMLIDDRIAEYWINFT